MSRDSLSSPPTTGQQDIQDSPFLSVRSDNTLDDYYFATQSDALGISPRTSVSSPLEYSDESEDHGSHHRRSMGAGLGSKSKFRTRPPESLLDNTSTMIHLPPKTTNAVSSLGLFRNTSQVLVAPEPAPKNLKVRSIQTAGDEEMQRSLQGSGSNSSRSRSYQRKTTQHKLSPHRPQEQRSSSNSIIRADTLDDSDDTSSKNNWMIRWAYSFRSPCSHSKKSYDIPVTAKDTAAKQHRRQDSDLLEEYPHYIGFAEASISVSGAVIHPPPPSSFEPWKNQNQPTSRGNSTNEESPLLGVPFSYSHMSSGSINDDRSTHNSDGTVNREDGMGTRTSKHKSLYSSHLATKVAAAFLQDYEANRPPTFGDATTLADISDYQMTLYSIKHSLFAGVFRVAATLSFFASSFMEGFYDVRDSSPYRRWTLTFLNMFAITVSLIDIWMRRELRGSRRVHRSHRDLQLSLSVSTRTLLEKHEIRISRSEKLMQPLIFFCALLALENIFRVFIITSGNLVLFSSILKPLVLFYISSQARDAFEAVRRILKIVLRVLVMELLLILMFAAVACRLFQQYEQFHDLGAAWISLFELATTVVNPSIWMPVYNDSKISALFFIFFIVTTVFYLHSLVLSVVFQTYIQAASDIHERNASNKEDAVYLSFLALLNVDRKGAKNRGSNTEHLYINIRAVHQTLRILRPHYSTMKINALVEIVDPAAQGTVDYTTFRTKIRQALNASIRTARNASNLALSVEIIAAAVAVVNFIYVLLVSSKFNMRWFDNVQVEVGCFITLVAAFELLIRFNPLRIPDFTPLTRLNSTFDGSALVAAVISCVGIILYVSGSTVALEYILFGRALDMIRVLRFFQIFRDICRRTSDVLPALTGPLILVVSTLHIFTYTGMAIWGGSVEVGRHPEDLLAFYDLNNFNSYHEGAVTMFQILTVNDWYAIADVFLLANRNSSQFIVYFFFIVANMICVSIMLNVLTAFFVESFVTKLHDDKDAPAEATTTIHKDRAGIIVEPDVRRVLSVRNASQMMNGDRDDDSDSEATTDSERFEFDVYERQGFDKIMQTVAGSGYQGDCARDICNYLEIYESLAPGRDTVGYLVCDQHTLERFGNRRFRTKAIGCLDENKLHSVVTDMHSELLALAPRSSFQDRSLVRTFPHKREPGKTLEISASLLRRHPALSLFVSRTIPLD